MINWLKNLFKSDNDLGKVTWDIVDGYIYGLGTLSDLK